jgi:hypothetical protein
VYVELVGYVLLREVDRPKFCRLVRARSFIARKSLFAAHKSPDVVDTQPSHGSSICFREWIAIATRGRPSSTTTTVDVKRIDGMSEFRLDFCATRLNNTQGEI